MEKQNPGLWIGAAVAVAVLVVAVSIPSGTPSVPQPEKHSNQSTQTQPESPKPSGTGIPVPLVTDGPVADTVSPVSPDFVPATKPQPVRDPDEPPPPPEPPIPPATLANVRQAIDDIDLVIRDFRAVHGENPVGDNAEITKALVGDNLKQLKLKLPDNSRVNNAGELCDLWGTPYFFHQVSGKKMEIRSAGPDRKMWTGDDVRQ